MDLLGSKLSSETDRSVADKINFGNQLVLGSHIDRRQLRWGRLLCEKVDVHVLRDGHLPRSEALQKRRLPAAVLTDQAVSSAEPTKSQTHNNKLLAASSVPRLVASGLPWMHALD